MPSSIEYPTNPIDSLNLKKYSTLKKNWKYSKDTLTEYHDIFNRELQGQDISIVLAGSYGRLEACPSSDFDFVILTQHSSTEEQKKKTLKSVIDVFARMKVVFPNPEGVFSHVVSIDECVMNIGHFDDSLKYLSQRVLLLLETKPLFNDTLFNSAVDQILNKYLEFLQNEPEKEALFLINDLIRYFRGICVHYQYNFWRQEEKWTLRNVKLRHSRIVMYAGTLLLLMNASKKKDKIKYIKEKMLWTPLERISHVYEDNNDKGFEKVLSSYEVFLRKISDPEIRRTLILDYNDRYDNPHYLELKVGSELLRSELTRFILARRKEWSSQVLEYIIF